MAVKALNQARLEANIRAYGDTNYKNKWPSPYAVASGTLLLLSFLKYVYSPLRWLAVVAIAVGILPIILKAIAAVRNLNLDINILVLITGIKLLFHLQKPTYLMATIKLYIAVGSSNVQIMIIIKFINRVHPTFSLVAA